MISDEKLKKLINIYNQYVCESQNIQDISRWVTKKTVTKSVYESVRPNETKVLAAIADEDTQEGDKVYLYSSIDGEKQEIKKGEPVFYKDGRPKMIPNKIVKLQKHWHIGDEDKAHYLDRVYKTLEILSNIVDMTQFIDYSLKKNRPQLEELLKS